MKRLGRPAPDVDPFGEPRQLPGPWEEARARRAAYRSHGEPSQRTLFEEELVASLGWDLRGRGGRARRLRRAVTDEVHQRPELFDTGYRYAVDTIRLQFVGMQWSLWIERLPTNAVRAWRHVNDESAGLPGWVRAAFNQHVVSALRERGRGRRWPVACTAAVDRIIADHIGISVRTVRLRRQARADWTPAEALARPA